MVIDCKRKEYLMKIIKIYTIMPFIKFINSIYRIILKSLKNYNSNLKESSIKNKGIYYIEKQI